MTKSKMFFCRVIAILMLFVSLFSLTVTASAKTKDENVVSPQYTTIFTNSTCITISGIKATCTTSMTAQYSTSLKIKMELQKKKSNGYETIETWTSSKQGVNIVMSESRNINILCDYRLKATFTAGSESTVVYKYPS